VDENLWVKLLGANSWEQFVRKIVANLYPSEELAKFCLSGNAEGKIKFPEELVTTATGKGYLKKNLILIG
jgi:hypothetical protein